MNSMIRVFLADARLEERSAIRRLLTDLKLDVVGEAGNWSITLIEAPVCRANMLVVDWDILPNSPNEAIGQLRKACPTALVVVLLSRLDVRQQAALSAGADAFISKGEMPERIAERLKDADASVLIS